MYEGRCSVFRVPEHDRIAVREGRKQRHTAPIGHEPVDAPHHTLLLVDACHAGAMNSAGDRERLGVDAEYARELAPRRHHRVGVWRVRQSHRAERDGREPMHQARLALEGGDHQDLRSAHVGELTRRDMRGNLSVPSHRAAHGAALLSFPLFGFSE